MKSRWLITLAFLALSILGAGAEDTATRIFNPSVHTLKISNPYNFMAPPVIKLGSDDSLVVSFDELGDSHSYLRARLIHCNADWQPSQLLESEYLPGFNETEIDDYAYSSNTFEHYVNYRLQLPDERLDPLVSGNYLLQVYDEYNPDDIWLQVRFYVVEPLATVKGEATSRTDTGFNTEFQQLNLRVDPGRHRIRDPFNDITLIVEQNSREATTRNISHPQRLDGNTLVYEHVRDLIFPAGNEYRRFETVRADYPGMHVDSVRFDRGRYHSYLFKDEERSEHDYLFDSTQKGRFMVREYNSTDSDLGADYVTVHFTLDFPEIVNGSIYVDGEMTHGLFSDFNRLTYNRDTHCHELAMPLKQGSYNYQYVAMLDRPGSLPSVSLVEGDKYETCNEYFVRIYQREPSWRADKLIGTAIIDYQP